jgi:hypothetical protein
MQDQRNRNASRLPSNPSSEMPIPQPLVAQGAGYAADMQPSTDQPLTRSQPSDAALFLPSWKCLES